MSNGDLNTVMAWRRMWNRLEHFTQHHIIDLGANKNITLFCDSSLVLSYSQCPISCAEDYWSNQSDDILFSVKGSVVNQNIIAVRILQTT